MSFTMYMYDKYEWRGDVIRAVQVERETEHMVVIKDSYGKERKERKEGTYFRTFDEAKSFVVDIRTRALERSKEDLERAQHKLELINKFKLP